MFIMLLDIVDIFLLKNIRDADCRAADDATVSAPNHRSRVSLTAFLRDIISSRHDLKSTTTGPDSTPNAPQGSKSEIWRTASAAATSMLSMLILVSEKKFVNV